MRSLVFIFSISLMSFTPDRTGHADPHPLFDMINEYRKSKDIPKLEYLKEEQLSADEWSKQQVRYPHHPDVVTFYENCASGYESMEHTLQGWKKSPGHNRNLLDRKIKYATVSVYVVKYSTYEKHYSVFRGYKGKAPN